MQIPADVLLHCPRYVQCTGVNWTVTLPNRPKGTALPHTLYTVQFWNTLFLHTL